MEGRRSIEVSGGGSFPYDRFQGISTGLKVLALAAGYAAFVWLTMFQLERGYLAMHEASNKADTSAQANGGRISEPGDIRFAARASTAVRPSTEASSTRLPGDAPAAAIKVDKF
jgi:hypothetical protein